jgi:O-antigen ligase
MTIVPLAMLGLIGIGLLVALVGLFARWERTGKEHFAPVGLLGLLVIEATLYVDQNNLPRSLFHPGSGSIQLRLPEIYITLALIGRLIGRGKPTRIGFPAALWLAFGVWMVVGIIEGHLYHNSFSQNVYEAKAIVYVVGGYALAAGVPVRRYLDTRALYWVRNLCVVAATVLDLMTMAHVTVSVNIPLLPLQGFGQVGSETAALFVAIGTMCFLPELASGRVRVASVVALVPLLASVVLANERAVLVNEAVMIGVLLIVLGVVGYGRGVVKRMKVQSGQVILTLLAVVAIALAALVVPAAVHQRPVQIPLSNQIHQLFHSQGKAESAQDRLDMASEAEALIPQHPIIGWGLGVEFPFYEAGVRKVQLTPYAHDLVLDLLLRLGVVGLLLYLAALFRLEFDGLGVWRQHPDPEVAAFALALVAILAGLFVYSLLEPVIDEYRLATLLGISMGMLRSAVTSPRPDVMTGEVRQRLQMRLPTAKSPGDRSATP